ncbi:MAG: hypothetical protein RID07_19125, partial [Lacipirellulaceae bacterium]
KGRAAGAGVLARRDGGDGGEVTNFLELIKNISVNDKRPNLNDQTQAIGIPALVIWIWTLVISSPSGCPSRTG